MAKKLLNFAILSAVLSLFMLGLLYFILPKFNYALEPILIEHWAFSFLLTMASFFVVLYIHFRNPNRTGFAFLGLVLVKMALAAVYIIPQLKEEGADKTFLMLHFFGAYFFLLFLEARELMLLLKHTSFDER